jgi:hypothetical protein
MHNLGDRVGWESMKTFVNGAAAAESDELCRVYRQVKPLDTRPLTARFGAYGNSEELLLIGPIWTHFFVLANWNYLLGRDGLADTALRARACSYLA